MTRAGSEAGSASAPAAVWTDLHSHVIPAVDDGAQDVTESLAAVAALRTDGVAYVVATPHLDGSLTLDPDRLAKRLERLDEGWERLLAAIPRGEAPVLGRGVELKLDVPEVDLSDPRVRLGGGPSVLVEFPFLAVPPRSAEVLGAIHDAGYQPLLAHPERYLGIETGLARSWRDTGAFLQVNAGSLTGRYGPRVMKAARELLSEGLAHCIASDFHARGAPGLPRARSLVVEWAGEAQARLLFEVNPGRLLRGEAPMPAAPMTTARSRFAGLKKLFPGRS